MNRDLADPEKIEAHIASKKKYKSLTTKNREIIISELRKTTNQFCPFCGNLGDYVDTWTIEHFYESQQKNPQRQCDWYNFIHASAVVNHPFDFSLEYPNVYSPEEVDFAQIFEMNILLFYIQPKDLDDQKAWNTIRRFKLNSGNLINQRKLWWKNKSDYLITSEYPYCEYINPWFTHD